MVMREVDEDLAIFLGIQSVEMEKKNDHLLVEESLKFDDDFKCMFFVDFCVSMLICMATLGVFLFTNSTNFAGAETSLVGAGDDFLSLEMEMRDHDW